MCGIAGKYNFRTNEPVSSNLVRRMTDVMAYRGPDDSGIYIDGPVGLGHRRLSIIDLSPSGHQPMSLPDRSLWITYNGEIYNFLSLRHDLEKKGVEFQSRCDTEVILHLYREYGTDCLDHLRGMFAFAIWNRNTRDLFLARDRIGKKPLFYFCDGHSLIFASEIKAILEDPAISRRLNYEALADYLKYQYVPDPKTIFQNIYKLKPGHFITCSSKGISTHEYWDVTFKENGHITIEEASDAILKVLSESVQLRMISDVPLGAFLSGGIDSSGIVALMSQAEDQPVTTCSIGFDSKEYDEIEFARIVARRFGADHHEFTVKQKAEDILRDLAFHFDEPFADASAVPTYYVSKIARKRVTVALSGDGGDENFAGYTKYAIDDVENRLRRKVPSPIRQNLCAPLSRILAPWHHPGAIEHHRQRQFPEFCRRSHCPLR